jgi:hypothetical protein
MCLLGADFMAYDPTEDASIPEERFIEVLMDNLMSERKTLHAPAAEVYGMVLRSHTREKKSNRETMHTKYVAMVKGIGQQSLFAVHCQSSHNSLLLYTANLISLFKKNTFDQYLLTLSKIAPKVMHHRFPAPITIPHVFCVSSRAQVQAEPSLHFLGLCPTFVAPLLRVLNFSLSVHRSHSDQYSVQHFRRHSSARRVQFDVFAAHLLRVR